MRILGMVLELNPMHNGHKYFIEEAKRKINPDLTIAIVSTNFTMRGDIMVMDKFTKAKLLKEIGIDIVLELPYLATVCSSDFFCYNAISSLLKLHITDLAFGVELNNIDKLLQMKDIVNSSSYNEIIKSYLDRGFSYPNSSYRALSELTMDSEIISNFTLPNNTLAIGYLNSLDKLTKEKHFTMPSITLIERIGASEYDDTTNDLFYNSASALRKALINGQAIDDYTWIHNYPWINQKMAYDNLLLILKYLFNNNDPSFFTNILGINEGIENRIASFINKSNTYDELVANIMTKRYSINRIKRILLNIVLNVPKTLENICDGYLRILAINEDGINYLHTLEKTIRKEIITSFKNINDEVSKTELKATKLYALLTKQNDIIQNEYNVPFR